MSLVPPQETALGAEAGKSTCGLPSLTPSAEPSSPDAARTVTPSAAADWKAVSNWCIAAAVQRTSAAPQLIEITDGLRSESCTAALMALRKPAVVFGAK